MKKFGIYVLVLCSVLLINGCTSVISEDKLYVIHDGEKVKRMVTENTPIRIEIQSMRWGKGVVDDQKIIKEVWEVSHQISKVDKSAYIPQKEDLIGTAYLLGGRRIPFFIGELYMQIGHNYYGSKEASVALKTAYQSVKENLYTVENIKQLLLNSQGIILYSVFDTKKNGVFLTKRQIEGLIDNVDSGTIISGIDTLKDLYEQHMIAQYQIVVLFDELHKMNENMNEIQSEDIVLITVYSSEYFTVWDMHGDNMRSIMHLKGNLFDYSSTQYNQK
ncbi:hypothetical protein SH2C18_31940 [Clostridium sediminicola]|uniref:DUF3919 family protein n=1 Tax=Clostridium sediminicola TaxID=3114879 RepID=UPI0031F2180E